MNENKTVMLRILSGFGSFQILLSVAFLNMLFNMPDVCYQNQYSSFTNGVFTIICFIGIAFGVFCWILVFGLSHSEDDEL